MGFGHSSLNSTPSDAPGKAVEFDPQVTGPWYICEKWEYSTTQVKLLSLDADVYTNLVERGVENFYMLGLLDRFNTIPAPMKILSFGK